MKKLFTILLLTTGIAMSQHSNLANNLYYQYENYKEDSLNKRRIKHKDILPLINKLKNNEMFSVQKAGESYELRDIYLIKAGSGKIRVFLWSQMHGDEPTATMALFDIFNFLQKNDEFNWFRKKILGHLSLYFIPMVNPDGAERYQRRNALEIDINRDAIRFETPEARLLLNVFDSIKPDFGFNLHDQSSRYSVGNSFMQTTIALLAPAFDTAKTINSTRANAIKLIGSIFMDLNKFIPGHIAKYSDDYEPRAFGDLFQSKGASTILVESGGWKDDTEKQFIRKLNFITLLCAFEAIADSSYLMNPSSIYDELPFNENFLYDIVLRNVQLNRHNSRADIGINFKEENCDSANFYSVSNIDEIGDLSTYYGIRDYDFNGLKLQAGKTYPKKFNSLKEIEKLDFYSLYSKGYTNVTLNQQKRDLQFSALPVNIILNKSGKEVIKVDKPANFLLLKNKKVMYVVINGFLIDVQNKIGKVSNGLVLK